MDKHKTKVIFLLERDEPKTVFAYFPELEHNGITRVCYAHVGQHSGCHPDYAKECKEASVKQYLDLYEELLSIGYNLKVLNKQKIKTIDRIVYPVNSRYGAPMGRANIDKRETFEVNGQTYAQYNGKLFDCRVPMPDGCYDKGGAYWGIGKELRVSYTKDLSFIKFYRVGDID